ncbi:galactinol synthase 2 [Quercus suber]|uniref:Galactinol synthase 2 n=1 Tax=Quercus suber TaxID=58331 RepID=A0AAW0JLJ1_QUESU
MRECFGNFELRFFKDIYKPIFPVYNHVLAILWHHSENIEFEKVKIVHYSATMSIHFGSKPWRYTGEEENMDREDIKLLVKRWWDGTYTMMSHWTTRTRSLASVEAETGAGKMA